MASEADKALALLKAGKLPEPMDAAVLSGFGVCPACSGAGEFRGVMCGGCGGDGRDLWIFPVKSAYNRDRRH